MSFLENITLAFGSLKANKMRALLTMLGIIIGIASVIAIMTVGNSLTGSLTSSMQSLGAGNITLSLQSKQSQGRFGMGGGMGFGIDADNLITDEMLEALREEYSEDIDSISLSDSVGSGQTTQGRNYANLSLTGVNVEYASANDITMTQGRFITERDIENEKKACVVSSLLVENMFGTENPLGQRIVVTVGDHVARYTIVGVYEYESSSMMGMTENQADVSTDVYIPLSTAQRISGSKGYQSLTVVTIAGVDATAFANTVTSFFDKYYAKNDDYGVSAFSMESMVESMTEMLSTVSLAIAAIAAISLLVGGIGVMNIMMVSITERTREIGTRKAIGATNGEIRIQFIVEAIVICLVGGLIGIALGVTIGSIASDYLGYSAQPSVQVMFLAAGFSMLIGVFFGYYPANKAAKLNPIDALRYE
jgi:putative ABC transport system permease protein